MAIIGDKFYCRWENTGKLHHISTVQSGFGIPKHRCRTFDAKMILFSSIKDLWVLVLCCLDFSSQELIFKITFCWPYTNEYIIYSKHIVIWHDPMPSVLVFSDTWHMAAHMASLRIQSQSLRPLQAPIMPRIPKKKPEYCRRWVKKKRKKKTISMYPPWN